jgi:hypothetical protein
MSLAGDIGSSYVGGVTYPNPETGSSITPTAAAHIWPVFDNNSTNAYLTNNSVAITLNSADLGDTDESNKVLMSAWCAQCHGAWHEDVVNVTATSGSDWLRHPVDNRLKDTTPLSGLGLSIVDFNHLTKTYGNLAVAQKLPVADGGGAAKYYADNTADEVFCLSCHFAHASPTNLDALRWGYTTAVTAGSQVGAGVPSDDGCQQCHNKGGSFGT